MSVVDIKHFVLVHGAGHGAWCWEKVVPILSDAGHDVHTLDLPGLGEDHTPYKKVTLSSYVNAVKSIIESIDGKVILVGHSMGGIVISQLAEKIPQRIESLVYVAAFIPKNGEALLQYALADTESFITRYKQVDEDKGYFTLPEEILAECFYGKCLDKDAEKAIKRIRPQALMPLATPVKLSEQHYGQVPCSYIECTEDKAVTLSSQRIMQKNTRLNKLFSLPSDHSPFYFCPDELTSCLLNV